MTVLTRLEDAGKLAAAAVAVDLDPAAAATVGRQQPGRLTALEARIEAGRLDPHAALVQRVADGMLGGERETQTPGAESDLRAVVDDAESVSGREWDIE